PQRFVIDRVLGLDQGARFLVMAVAPLAGAVLLRFGQPDHRLAPAVAALLARVAKDSSPRSIPVSCPGDGRGWLGSVGGGRGWLGMAGDGRGWAGMAGDGPGQWRWRSPPPTPPPGARSSPSWGPRDRARPAHPAPSALGPRQAAVVQSPAVALRRERGRRASEGERGLASPARDAPKARLLAARHAPEDGLIGPVPPGPHVVHDVTVDRGVVGGLCSSRLPLGFRAVPRDGDVTALVGGAALLHGGGGAL